MGRWWAELQRFGPYFTFGTGAEPAGRGLADAAGSLVDATARTLGTDDRRVAGSIAYQGLAARLWSLTAGAAVVAGLVPDVPTGAVRLTAVDPVTPYLVSPGSWPTREATAGPLLDVTLTRHLEPLARTVSGAAGTPLGILAGDAASALVGTFRVLAADHTLAERAGRLAAAAFARPELAGTGTLDVTGRLPAFRRTDCCLYYRVLGGGLCGDCVLRR
ncbi:MAG TPA: (2Fe-2S)-binding protein [Streptosporangiales bacterium]